MSRPPTPPSFARIAARSPFGIAWGALPTALLLLTATPSLAQDTPPWEWSDERVMEAVNQVRAGRDLNPPSWPGGARVAVLLSFDVDNETVNGLRDGEVSIGPLSEGQYGSRRALPRFLDLHT